MKTSDMFRRVDGLSEKLKATDCLWRVDYNSLSEAEKRLFQAGDEAEAEYRRTGNAEILIKNWDVFCKEFEVFYNHTTELYISTVPKAVSGVTGLDHEIVDYFFKLHFLNFREDLFECLKNLCRWDEQDKEEFFEDLKKNGSIFFRIPRGFPDSKENVDNLTTTDPSEAREEKPDEI
jgi:hypothetical protein